MHECPDCKAPCDCEAGEADVQDCQHNTCDLGYERDFSDDEAQYNYED